MPAGSTGSSTTRTHPAARSIDPRMAGTPTMTPPPPTRPPPGSGPTGALERSGSSRGRSNPSAHPAPESGAREGGAVPERAKLRPDRALGHELRAGEGPEPTIHGRDHTARVAHRVDGLKDPVGHDFGMLDEVRGRVDDPGQEQHRVGQGVPPEHLVLVRVTGIRQLERERPDPRPIDERQDRLQGDVGGVRAVVVAPADVQPDAVRGDLRRGAIDGLDVRLDDLQKALEGLVLEEPRALHREIRAVELEQEAARVDQLVLLLHLPREGEHVPLVRIVVAVEQGRRDDARGGGGHEALDERLGPRRRGLEQQVALPGGFAEVDVLDLGQGLRRVRDLRGRASAKLQQRRVVGKVDEVAGRGAATLAPKPTHAPRHVGGEADAGLLAVVADVNARVELLADDRADGSVDLARQLGRVDGLAALLPGQELAEPRRPREAPDVRDENPPFAPVQDVSPYTRPFARAAERGAPRPRIAKRRIPHATSHGAWRWRKTATLPWPVTTVSRRRRATARTICRAARAVGMTRRLGKGSRGSGCQTPRLSTWRISLSTKPGLTSVTATPCGTSSWPSDSASARTANLLIA